MKKALQIRATCAGDRASTMCLYREAFPDEDLLPLVEDLLNCTKGHLSLAALVDPSLLGHVFFTTCRVDGCQGRVALLGPLAVAPAFQRRGIGSALVREGLTRLTQECVTCVCVLGNPSFYGRFGFDAEPHILPPYPLVAEWRAAWQSLRFETSAPSCPGRLNVPEPWQRPSLWAP